MQSRPKDQKQTITKGNRLISIIKTLLTGGSLLGKMCRMISESGIVHTTVGADGKKLTAMPAHTEINGVRFTQIVKENGGFILRRNWNVCGFHNFVDSEENNNIKLN